MSTVRHERAGSRRKRLGRNKGECTWCGQQVPKGRFSFCSADCVQAFKLTNDAGAVRAAVLERDDGICALCRVDTKVMHEIFTSLRELQPFFLPQRYPHGGLCRGFHKRTGRGGYYECWCQWCVSLREARDLSAWEADHIVPVVEGGGLCGLDNYRTLCLACHKEETAKLTRRLAARRTAR